MIFEILVYPGLAFLVFMSLLYSGILRKVTARMQHRIGPSWFQPFYDILKLLGKEDIDPEQAKPGFTFWPIIALVCVLVTGLVIPIAGQIALSSSADIIVVIYFLTFSSMAMYMSGFASSNPFSVIGSIRGIIQMVAYEFPFVASILVPVVFLQTFSPQIINSYQLSAGPFIYLFPLAAMGFFVSILAETEIPPFHVPRSHQEIVSGYATEYSGSRLAMLELTHFVKLFVMISLFLALFLGGSFDILTFVTRTLVVLFLVIVSRTVMARFRINAVLKICWLFGFITVIDLVRVILL